MKNLRKVLALVLVVASLMGVAVVANADFTDADKVSASNKQAVDVLNALDIVAGYPDGDYRPNQVVKRGEMAKMIATILNGGEDVKELYEASCTFADSKNHWAAGYIGYCATMGVIGGRNENVFDPEASVTAVEAAKMVLCALDYKSENEGFSGTSWKGNVLNYVKSLDLFNRVATNPDEGMTRENAAQLLWNGLNQKYVEYKGGTRVEIAGVTFVTGAEAEDNKDGKTLLQREFKDVTVTRDHDEFNRPVTKIVIDSDEPIITVDNPDLVANKAVQTKQIYNLIGKVKGEDLSTKGITVKSYDADGKADAYKESIEKMTSKTTAAIGATGDRVEIYWDADAKQLDVLVFATGAIEIADVTVNKTAKTTTVKTSSAAEFGFEAAANKEIVFQTAETNITEDNEGDVAIVNLVNGKLYNLYLPTVVTGTSEGTVINKDNALTTLYLNGKSYTCDDAIDDCVQDAPFTAGKEFNVYLGEGDIAHAFKTVVEAEKEAKYAYVIDADKEGATFGENTWLAKVLFPNGTVEIVETAEDAETKVGVLCSYTVDSKNVYTLKDADKDAETVAITKNSAAIGSHFANKSTVFVVETTVNDKPQYDVYTGINNIPSLETAKILVVTNAKTEGLLDIVYCLESKLADSSSATAVDVSMVYAPAGLKKYTKLGVNDTEYSYYVAAAWINGKDTSLKLSPEKYAELAGTAKTDDALTLIKGYTVDDNGVVINVVKVEKTALTEISSMTANWKSGVITMNGAPTYIEEGTPVYVYELNSSALEKHTIEELDDNAGSDAESFKGGWFMRDANGAIAAIYGIATIN